MNSPHFDGSPFHLQGIYQSTNEFPCRCPNPSIEISPRCPLQYHLSGPFLQEIRIGVAPGSGSDGIQRHLRPGMVCPLGKTIGKTMGKTMVNSKNHGFTMGKTVVNRGKHLHLHHPTPSPFSTLSMRSMSAPSPSGHIAV